MEEPKAGPNWYRIKLTHRDLFIILKALNRFAIGTRKRFRGNQMPIGKIVDILEKYLPKEKWKEYSKEWKKIREELQPQQIPKDQRPKPKPEKPIRGKGFYYMP